MRSIFNYTVEIIFAIMFILMSIVLWDYYDFSSDIKYAKYYSGNFTNKQETNNLISNLNSKLEYDNLIPTTYELLDKTDAKYLMVKNNSINPVNYKIEGKISKKSSSDINNLVLVINDKKYHLNGINYKDTGNDYSFELGNYEIIDNDFYRIMVYLDKSISYTSRPHSLFMDINIIEI